MKWNITLTWITIGYILVNIIFYSHAPKMTGGSSLVYVVVYPFFWGLVLIVLGIVAFRKRKDWFSEDFRISTIILLFLCTPLPLLAFTYANRAEMTRISSTYTPKNGVTIKEETWNYLTGETGIIKYWKLNKEDWLESNENEFKMDSTWIYFDKNGDTLKTETYKDDRLLVLKEYK